MSRTSTECWATEKCMRAMCLPVPASDPGKSVRDVGELDVGGVGGQQIEAPT